MSDIFTVISPSGIPINPNVLRHLTEEGQAGKLGKDDIPGQKERTLEGQDVTRPDHQGSRRTGRSRRAPRSSSHPQP